MKKHILTYPLYLFLLLSVWILGGKNAYALSLDEERGLNLLPTDSLTVDSLALHNQKALEAIEAPIDTMAFMLSRDSIPEEKPLKPKTRFVPNPNKSVWLAMVIPGGGQIYNRKYWKLPLVYGGFIGCAYALSWNNMMYKDYSQAYLDIMDDDPNTKSYEDFLPLNSSIEGQEDHFKTIFKNRKDLYRRQRDLSIFCFIGVYLLSVIDAYVDAELSNFDITKDIGMKVEPAIFNDGNSKKFNTVGLQCSIKF